MPDTQNHRIKAYSYLRFSTPEQMKGDSLRRQIALAEAYALKEGLDLMDVSYRDLGVSAYRGANVERGALSEFLEAVRAGEIATGSYLLVESLDRLSRDKARRAMRTLEDICDAGITVVTLVDGRLYTKALLNDDPMALMYLIVVAMRANEESLTKSRRLKAAWSNKRKTATDRVLTARAPTWLKLVGDGKDRRFEVIEEKANVLRRIFELAKAGMGQNKIAQTLNAAQVPTLDGGKVWYRSNIAKLLNSESVLGVYVPHTVETNEQGKKVRKPVDKIESYYPLIVDPETFAQVRATAFDTLNPRRGRHADGAIRNILGGLACCPLCESTMTRVTKGSGPKGGKPFLVCVKAKQGAGCVYRSVRMDLIEEALVGYAGMIVGEAPAPDAEGDLLKELQGMWFALSEMGDQIETLTDAYVSSRSPAIQEKLRKAEAKRETLEEAHRALTERVESVQGPLLRKRLDRVLQALGAVPLDIEEANLALRAVLSKVVVDYRSGCLGLEWKHGGQSSGPMFLFPEDHSATE